MPVAEGGPPPIRQPLDLQLVLLNAMSTLRKSIFIHDLILDEEVYLVCVTEPWVDEQDGVVSPNCTLGYWGQHQGILESQEVRVAISLSPDSLSI